MPKRGHLAWLAGILALTCAALPAVAADYAVQHRLYNEALARGDYEAAVTHSLAAWQFAEVELGAHPSTAVLAYNYGQLILFNDPVEALPALRRADALQRAGIGDLPRLDLDCYLAYAVFKTTGEKNSEAEALHAAMEARHVSGAPPTFEVGRLWSAVAAHDLRKRRYGDAIKSSARAEDALRQAAPGDSRGRAEALLIGGVARTLHDPRIPSMLFDARVEFRRARMLLPLQDDLDTFDPLFAQLLAWDAAAFAALTTYQNLSYYGLGYIKPPQEELVFNGKAGLGSCTPDWDEKSNANYPVRAKASRSIGAALLGYNLAEDGSVADYRVLAEVPQRLFGENSIKAFSKWRARTPLDPRLGCRKNLLFFFVYVME